MMKLEWREKESPKSMARGRQIVTESNEEIDDFAQVWGIQFIVSSTRIFIDLFRSLSSGS
jgi:hypothetical protein